MIPTLRGTVDPTVSTDPATPLLVLGPSLGTVSDAWTRVGQSLTGSFRVVRYDLPGHGISPATTESFTVAELADAVVSLVDSVGGGTFSYAGVSLGGAIGIELALGAHAARLDGLAIVCSNAKLGTADSWLDRAAQVRAQGTASMVRGSSERWFAPGFLARDPETGSRALNDLLDIDDESYALCCEALAAFDRVNDVQKIAVPTLVAHGDSDPVVSVDDATTLAAAIPDATRVQFEQVGHQAHMEAHGPLATALLAALTPASAGADGRYEAGLVVRRAVLSDAHVDASLAGITPETADFQRFITEYAWGSIWTRPGLDRRMRSAVTLASLITAGHWHEVEMHLRAALRNGLTRAEISEILLQTAIYAGVPAANSAFGIAKRVFADADSSNATDEVQ